MTLKQLFEQKENITKQITMSSLKFSIAGVVAAAGYCGSYVIGFGLALAAAGSGYQTDMVPIGLFFPTVTAISSVYSIRHGYLVFKGRRKLTQINKEIESFLINKNDN
jgi:hypothetical protein